jgi:hypothetical protein
MADKEPQPGGHEDFIKPLRKQGVGSTVHCVAGDATGILVAAVVTALVGLPMWIDLIVEYTAGVMFGLLTFQALFMRKIIGGTYAENVRRSFLPELILMNCMMAGMAPVMIYLMMGRDMRACGRESLCFGCVAWHYRRLRCRLPGQCLAGVARHETRADDGTWGGGTRSNARGAATYAGHGESASGGAVGMADMDHGSMKTVEPTTVGAKPTAGGAQMLCNQKTAAKRDNHKMGSSMQGGSESIRLVRLGRSWSPSRCSRHSCCSPV